MTVMNTDSTQSCRLRGAGAVITGSPEQCPATGWTPGCLAWMLAIVGHNVE